MIRGTLWGCDGGAAGSVRKVTGFDVARGDNAAYSGGMNMHIKKIVVAALMSALGLAASPAVALETSLQYVLTLTGDVERTQVRYDCEGREELLIVEYVNAFPNFLAIMELDEDGPLVFVNVISGSGARYVAGHFEWWTKGAEASLTDLMTPEPDAPEFTCLEFNDIP